VRWRAPFRRSGVAIPLLAGCLIAALVAVMFSAMFTANPYAPTPPKQAAGASSAQPGTPKAGGTTPGRSSAGASAPASGRSRGPETAQPSPSAPTAPASAPPAGAVRTTLPRKAISVEGHPLALRTVHSAALAIVPANCDCLTTLRQLLTQVESAGVMVYLVGSRGSSLTPLNQLATSTAAATRAARVAADDANVLTSTFRAHGLTVLLVDAHGAVTVDARLHPGLMLEKQLALLGPGR
jgi:hypothetical protein